MAGSCNEEEIMQILSSMLVINGSSKLCPMLNVEQPRQRRGQKPIEDFTVNAFSLPSARHTMKAQQGAGKCSCRRVQFPQDVVSDYFRREPGFEPMLNNESRMAPYNAVCTCLKIPLALLPSQQNSSGGSCRCVETLSEDKSPQKVTTGTGIANMSVSGGRCGSASKQKPLLYEVATQSEAPPKPAKVQKPPGATSKCKNSEDDTCPCCKRKSKRNKKEKPNDTNLNLDDYNKIDLKKSSMSAVNKNTQKKGAAGTKSESSGELADTEDSTTLLAPPSVNKSAIKITKNNRKNNNVPGEFVEESKSLLPTGQKLKKNMVKARSGLETRCDSIRRLRFNCTNEKITRDLGQNGSK